LLISFVAVAEGLIFNIFRNRFFLLCKRAFMVGGGCAADLFFNRFRINLKFARF